MSMKWWKGVVRNECIKHYGIDPLKTSIAPARIYGEITLDEVYELMPKVYTTPNGVEYRVRSSIFDSKYNLTSITEIKRFLEWDRTENVHDYSLEDFDCDDFAFVLTDRLRLWSPGLAQGILIVPGHAKNFFIDARKKVWGIEPQSDRVNLIPRDVHQYIM